MFRAKSFKVVFASMLLVCIAVATVHAAPKTTITLALYGDITGWEEVTAAFSEANPDIAIEIDMSTYSAYINKVTTMVAGGTPPDIVMTWNQYKPQWVALGLVQDVTDRWKKSAILQKAIFYPFMLEAAQLNGRFYGVPYDYNSHVWFHDLDHMAEKGVQPPTDNWTVDDLRALAQKLNDPQKKEYGVHNPIRAGDHHFTQWAYNWSGYDWITDNYSKVMVDQPEVLEMIGFWNDIQNNMQVTNGWPGAWAPRGDYFAGGYAMWQGWLSFAPANAHRFAYDWNITLMPKAQHGQESFAQGHMFSIPLGAKNPDAAWRFLEWMGSYEGQKALVSHRSRQPVGHYPELWKLFFANVGGEKARRLEAWVTNVFYGQALVRNFTYWPTYPEMTAVLRAHLTNIFSRQSSVANEMLTAAAKLQAILDASSTY